MFFTKVVTQNKGNSLVSRIFFEKLPMAAAASGGGSGQGASTSNKRKRTNPPPTTTGLFSGVVNSVENKDVDLLCPICMDVFNECYISKCGHSFCYECICRCLDQSPRCPKCNFHLVPNAIKLVSLSLLRKYVPGVVVGNCFYSSITFVVKIRIQLKHMRHCKELCVVSIVQMQLGSSMPAHNKLL